MGQYCHTLTAQNILNDKIKVEFCMMTFFYSDFCHQVLYDHDKIVVELACV